MINWESKENHLLVNPRLESSLREQVATAWTTVAKEFEGHVGLLTSGSSGSAKLVLLSKSALLTAARGANQHLTAGRSDTWIKTLPHFHVGGLSIFARSFLSGSRVVESKMWNADHVYELAKKEKATLISLVPAQLFDFVSRGLSCPPTLRAAIIGGSTLQPELYKKARALSWPVLPSYGLTECCSQVATAAVESLTSEFPTLLLLDHIEAKLGSGKKLMIKSDALLTGYVDLTTKEFFDPKVSGWFTTEDVAELNDRDLIPKGRSQDFLKIGGESSDFISLENTFASIWQTFSFKGDAALLPLPDDRLGSIIVLLSSGLKSNEVQELVEKYNAKVMPYERIRHARETKSIPRSELGKLLRAKAIEEYSRLS